MGRSTALAVLAESRSEHDWHQRFIFLENSVILNLTAKVADRAERILLAVPVPTPLTADDALAAATALVEKLPLYTLDPVRYAGIPDLTVCRVS